MQRSARKHNRAKGHYALSGCSLPDLSAEEIAEAMGGRRLPHARMRWCKAKALRDAGYEVEPEGAEGHVAIRFSHGPTDDDWTKLDEIFCAPTENPVKQP